MQSTLLPAAVGLLAAAGADHNLKASFLPLAAVSGAGLWTYALVSGGPRRFHLPLALFVMASAGLAGVLIWFLPVAQPHVQDFVVRAYADARTGLSDRSELGEVESLAQSSRVVARVWTPRPGLLRMQVFTSFDGRRWAVGRQAERVLSPLDAERTAKVTLGPLLRRIPGHRFAVADPPAGVGVVETKIMPALSFEDGWGLLVPAGPALLVWPGQKLTIDELGRVTAEGRAARLYGVVTAREGRLGTDRATPADLALPALLDPRVRRLADDLRLGARSDREIVQRTVAHLRSRYRYTLHVGRFRTRDPLAEFLFDKQAGYCEYFASAAVVLLRLQGVPARYVKGVSLRGERQVAGHYLVRESDAHAWIDAYLADGGWIEEDPTPANGYELTHPAEPAGFLAAAWEALAARWSEAWARFRQGTWPRLISFAAKATRLAWEALRDHLPAAGALLAAVALVLGLRLRRHRPWRRRRRPATRPGSAPVPADLRAALDDIERLWARCGHPRSANRGLREHLDAIPAGVLSPDARQVSAAVVASYYEARFGGRAPSSEELAALRRATRAFG